MPDSVGPGRTEQGEVNKGRLGPNRAGQDLAWSTEPDRGGKGSVRQWRGRQGRVDSDWVSHGRIGRVGRDRAGSCKAGLAEQDQAVSGRVGQDSARQVGSGQRQPGQGRAGQGREVPGRTGRGRKGSVSAGQGCARLDKTWHGQQNRTEAGRAGLFC